MIRKLGFLLLPAALLIIPRTHAQDAAQFSAAPAATWRIGCHGTSTVPLTSDAEQALPLNLVANLKCGDEVIVLSSLDSYTVHVQTTEGVAGYVAAIYLKRVAAPRRPQGAANLKNGVARWADGAPGCDQFMSSDGSLVESLTVGGVTVQVSLYDTGWKFRAQVAVANNSSEPVPIDPSKFILDELGPQGKPLFYQDPEVLAKNMTHQVLWSEANASPNVQARAESSLQNSETVNLTYKTPIRSTSPSPNYLLPHQDAEDDAIRTQGKQTLVDYPKQIQALALRPGGVAPAESISGAVWFERSKNPQQLMLRVPIENLSFEFPLSFHHRK